MNSQETLNKLNELFKNLYKKLNDDDKEKFLYENHLLCEKYVNNIIEGSDLTTYRCRKCCQTYMYYLYDNSSDVECRKCKDFVCLNCDVITVNNEIYDYNVLSYKHFMCNSCAQCYYCEKYTNILYDAAMLCCFDCLASFDHIKTGLFSSKEEIIDFKKEELHRLKDLTLCSIYYNKLNYKEMFNNYPLLFNSEKI